MNGSGYNVLSRFTHRLALKYPAVAEVSYDLQQVLYPQKDIQIRKPVFISGLARSGTTILLQYLCETGVFAASSYRDMPFVLMPDVWRKLSRQNLTETLQERAHDDGIWIGPSSPEAFEEVFWRVFCGKDYIKQDRLVTHQVDVAVSGKFLGYMASVIGGDARKRYLSKNNNNILRLGYLVKSFPDASIIVPFRNPLQHAISLLDQHLRFSNIQQKDKFALNYMNWLCHHEFGLNQKAFFFGDDAAFERMTYYSTIDINYWLLNWKNYYGYLLGQMTTGIILLDYDAFCGAPAGELGTLLERLAIEGVAPDIVPFKTSKKAAGGVKDNILYECLEIYQQLKELLS